MLIGESGATWRIAHTTAEESMPRKGSAQGNVTAQMQTNAVQKALAQLLGRFSETEILPLGESWLPPAHRFRRPSADNVHFKDVSRFEMEHPIQKCTGPLS